ncbi:hypothetical protein K438DRAFT_1996693 [Mycena galopus ATCC 62051]|nr:hypothetical protein K438DRAFT_1996693 [Mycena galopus ATCC 62051]
MLETLQIDAFQHEYLTAIDITAFEPSVVLGNLPPTSILLPWKQLTHFSAENLNSPSCLHVLRSVVALVECKSANVRDTTEAVTLLPTHSSLRVLHLSGNSVCLDILSILTLPALFELDFSDGRRLANFDQVAMFLSRSLPPLEHLSLHQGYSRLRHISPFLLQLTTLELENLLVSEISKVVPLPHSYRT